MARASAPTRTWHASGLGLVGSTRRSTHIDFTVSKLSLLGWAARLEGLHGLIPDEDFVQDARRDWKDHGMPLNILGL